MFGKALRFRVLGRAVIEAAAGSGCGLTGEPRVAKKDELHSSELIRILVGL